MQIVVTGIGLVSALGNLDVSWQRLLAGESAIQVRQLFAELPPLPIALVTDIPQNLTALTHQVVASALQDAGLTTPLPAFGVVIGSSRSDQATWEQLFLGSEQLSSWLDTLPHMAAIAVARQIGSTGPVLAPMAACATGIWAIAQAVELILTGQCHQVIAGAVEAPITPLTLAGFHQMGALAKTGAYPFDRDREGLVLGEGGAVFVLESADVARSRSAPIYGEVLHFGLTNDALHAIKPDESRKSAITAIKQCCDRSKITLGEIDYIHAHGTGTKLNDRHEADLIQQLFSRKVSVSSTKGATGHTLGASGALGIAFSLMTLRDQILPPCVGLRESEFNIDLVTSASHCRVQKVICLSFGFGGQNAAIAFSHL